MKNYIEKKEIKCDLCKGQSPEIENCRRCNGKGKVVVMKTESLSENAKVLME